MPKLEANGYSVWVSDEEAKSIAPILYKENDTVGPNTPLTTYAMEPLDLVRLRSIRDHYIAHFGVDAAPTITHLDRVLFALRKASDQDDRPVGGDRV